MGDDGKINHPKKKEENMDFASSSSSSSSSPSSSLRLVLFMVPAVVLVLGFASAQSPANGSVFGFNYYSSWLWRTFFPSSSPPPPPSSSTPSIIFPESNVSSTLKNNMPEWIAVEDAQAAQDRQELHSDDRKTVVQNVAARSDDIVSANRSSSPPLPQPQPQPHVGLQGENLTEEAPKLKISIDVPLAVPSTNDHNRSILLTGTLRKEYSRLDRLETGLRRARAAIRSGNRTKDPDYVPVGPMYRNPNAFHRSYLQMEKHFKVYVYEEGEPPVFHNGPCKSIYSMEGNFIHQMEMNAQFRTRDPESAHVYFLPFSVTMLVRFVYVRDSHDFSPIKHTVRDYLRVLGTKYPFWNRSGGADHFMLACHDWGPETSRSVPNLHKNAIRVLCNANTSEGFNPAKDASFPEINLQTGGTRGLLGGPSPSRRPILAFFAGGLHGPIRPLLLDRWKDRDSEVQVHQYLPRGVSYYEMLRRSKYCLCPSGYEVASPRIVEALYTGCVPVLISDHYVPPFSDVLDWKAFSVEVPVSEIPNLKRILEGISPRRYIRLQARGKQVRRHFEVNSPPRRFDVFHMILHSVWLRRLNVRVRE